MSQCVWCYIAYVCESRWSPFDWHLTQSYLPFTASEWFVAVSTAICLFCLRQGAGSIV